MKRLAYAFFLLILACSSFAAMAQDDHVVYIGANKSTPQAEAAIVIFNRPEDPRAGVKTLVTAIRSEEKESERVQTRRATAAVLSPGKYTIVGYCVLSLRDSLQSKEIELEAGQRYLVQCVGRTPRTVELTVRIL